MKRYPFHPAILIIVDSLPSHDDPNRWIFVIKQVQNLSRRCKITVIAPVIVPPPLSKYAAEKSQIEENHPYTGKIDSIRFYQPRYIDLPRGSYRYNDYSRIASIIGCIFRERIPIDIINAHFAYWPGHAGGIVGKILRKPLLLTVHGSDIHQMTKPDFPRPLWRKRAIAALQMSNRIIAVSNALKDMITELGYGEKTSVISSGFVSKNFGVFDRKMCRKSLGLQNDNKIILYIGTMRMIKGSDVGVKAFIKLAKKNDKVIFVLIGDGELRPDLEKVIRHAGLSKLVRFEGWKPNAELVEYLNAADLLVVPSRNEGAPIAIMESLACGTPVVATRVGGIPELLINENFGILVEPENHDAFAKGISSALERSWDRGLLNRHAQQYSWENIAPRIYKIYSDMINDE